MIDRSPAVSTRRLLLAYAIGLVPAMAMALGQPVWSRVDEAAHYDVIAQYAAGVYPRDSVTTIRPETLEVMERTGVYGFVVDNAYARPDVSAGFQAMPSGLDDTAHVLWIRRHGFQYSYESFQPPLYYLSALPGWQVGKAAGGALGAVYAVRMFDALLAALLAPLCMLITLRLWPANASAAWTVAVLAAVLPGVPLNLASITNDALVSVLGAACILVALDGRWTWRRIALAGALLGAALLTKTTAVALVPAIALALLDRSRAGGLRALVGGGAVTAVLFVPWLMSNLAIYGELLTTKEQLAMSAFPARTAAPDFWSVSTLHAFVTFWSGDPFLSLATAVPLTLVAAFITALAIAGLVRAYRDPASPIAHAVLWILVLAAAGAFVVSATSPVLAAFNAPGRLAYVGLGAVLALVAAGLRVEVPSVRLVRGVISTFAALSVIGLAVLAFPAPPVPSNPGQPVLASVQSPDRHGEFGGVSIDLQKCTVDTSGDLWLLLLIRNTGPSPAEWSQSAEVRGGGEAVATSGYSHSTPFPMTLPPGRDISGWLWLGPRTRLAFTGPVTVQFRDIATDGYRSIGTVDIPTALC